MLQALQYHGCFKLTNIQINTSTPQGHIQGGVADSKIKGTGISKANSKIGLGGISASSLGLGVGVNQSSVPHSNPMNSMNNLNI